MPFIFAYTDRDAVKELSVTIQAPQGAADREARAAPLRGLVHQRRKNPKDRALYYIHGGGFVNGYTRGSFRFLAYVARMMYVRLKEAGVDAEYHELRDFFHAMLTACRFGFVRREEYPHILRFIKRVFGETP